MKERQTLLFKLGTSQFVPRAKGDVDHPTMYIAIVLADSVRVKT